ncbi:MAG: hypothetical protein PVJ28_00060 [Acidimicrobiia bacterium]|jgi:hypothetical protein
MSETLSKTSQRTVVGVALTNAILLVYGLFRPDSLDFSIPFLIAPSLALLGILVARERAAKLVVLLTVVGVVAGLIVVILINELTN